MTKNENTVDRVARVIVAVVATVIALSVGVGTVGGVILLVVAAVMVATAAVGFCPLYRLLGISTCKLPSR